MPNDRVVLPAVTVSIWKTRREVVAPPSHGTRSVPDGILTGNVVVTIDAAKLAELLGPRALRTKSGRATLAHGAIVAIAHNIKHVPEGT